MKKLMLLAVVMCLVTTTGCALFMKPVIQESRDNLVTQLKTTGVIVDKVQYLDMLDNKGVTATKVPTDLVGKYYVPKKYYETKNNQVFLVVPEKSALLK